MAIAMEVIFNETEHVPASSVEAPTYRLGRDLDASGSRTGPVLATGLPAELLGEIFSYYQGLQYPRNAWIIVTHICTYWRIVARSTPRLWSVIYVGRDLARLHAYLQYSQNVPLDISFHRDVPDRPAVMDAIIPHASRIFSMDISHAAVHKMLPHLDFCMPALESLSMRLLPDNVSDEDGENGVPWWTYCFTRTANQFPRLCTLSLTAVDIPLTSQVFTSLVHLDLRYVHPKVRSSMNVFLDVLDRCPGLETLTLHNSAPPIGEPHPLRRSSLTQLRAIDVLDKSTNISYLLNHLVIPSKAYMQFEIIFSPVSFLMQQRRMLSTTFPPDKRFIEPFGELRNVLLILTSPFMKIVASATPDDVRVDNRKAFLFFPNASNLSSSSIYEDVGELFAASPVSSLEVRGDMRSPSAHQWRTLFAGFPCLEHLRVSADVSPHELIYALGTEGTEGAVCPGLKTLLMENFSYGSDGWAPASELTSALWHRAERGMRLESLTIVTLFAEHARRLAAGEGIMLLREVVGTLDIRSIET
ncbi:hypothetical protein B0H21DRAFT_478074 [Amylocystis lapponica]|nr:hypothetical protein B0H21DRAFT_478074 [Amylocystis lapponica]